MIIEIVCIVLGLLIVDVIVFTILRTNKIIKSKRFTIERIKEGYPFSGYVLLYRYLKNLNALD